MTVSKLSTLSIQRLLSNLLNKVRIQIGFQTQQALFKHNNAFEDQYEAENKQWNQMLELVSSIKLWIKWQIHHNSMKY